MADLYRAVARFRDHTLVGQPTPWRDRAEKERAGYATDAVEAWIEVATWKRCDRHMAFDTNPRRRRKER